MPFCNNCGTKIEETERFCANCGNPQGEMQPQLQGKRERSSKKLIPILIAIIVIIVIGGSAMIMFNDRLLVDQANDVSQYDTEKEISRGNSVGNIVNDGLAAWQDDWIYYVNNYWEIYKIKTDGSGREKINDEVSLYINVVGDWIYYSNENDYYKIYKVKTDGSEREKINDEVSLYINVVGDWIYYSNENDYYKIYKVKTDGSEREKINDDGAWYINVVGDWIYYSNFDDGGRIYKVKTDGSGREKIINGASSYVNVVGDWIYYINDFDGLIYKVKTDGSGREKVNGEAARFINVIGDWIYYSSLNYADGYKIYKIKTDGSGREKVNDDASSYVNVAGDWIYYINDYDDLIYKVKTDGSGRQKVEGLPQAPSLKTYTIVGLFPLTGTLNTLGENSLEAAELATADINKWLEEEGKNWRLSFEIDDTMSDASVGLRRIQSWFGEGANFFVGPMASHVAHEMLSFANSNQILIISPSSTHPDLAIEDDWLFRFCYDETLDTIQPPVIGDKSYREHVRNHIISKLGREPDEEFAFNTYDIIWAIALSIDSVGYNTQLVKNVLPDIVEEWSSVYGASGLIVLNKAGDRVSPY